MLLQRVGRTVRNHKGKLIAAAAVIVGVAAYFQLTGSSPAVGTASACAGDGESEDKASTTSGDSKDTSNCSLKPSEGEIFSPAYLGLDTTGSSVGADSGCSAVSSKSHDLYYNYITEVERMKLLSTANEQFYKIFPSFLKTLKGTLVNEIDITSVVKQIRDIRESEMREENVKIESRLTDEIKICSFCLFIINAFMISICCVLMRVQIHLLAKYFHVLHRYKNAKVATAGTGIDLENDQNMFRIIINQTYETALGSGLKLAIENVRLKVVNAFRDWIVEDKVEVRLDDLMNQVSIVRKLIEGEIDSFLKSVLLCNEHENSDSISHRNDDDKDEKDDNENSSSVYSTNNSIGGCGGSSNSNNMNSSKSDSESRLKMRDSSNRKEIVRQVLNQTWDIVESPMFAASVLETVDSYFRMAFGDLRNSLFHSSEGLNGDFSYTTSAGSGIARSTGPGLTAVLPCIKSMADTLFPCNAQTSTTNNNHHNNTNVGINNDTNSTSSHGINNRIAELIDAGLELETLCHAVLEATCMQTSNFI